MYQYILRPPAGSDGVGFFLCTDTCPFHALGLYGWERIWAWHMGLSCTHLSGTGIVYQQGHALHDAKISKEVFDLYRYSLHLPILRTGAGVNGYFLTHPYFHLRSSNDRWSPHTHREEGGIEAALFTSLAADLGMHSTLPPNQKLGWMVRTEERPDYASPVVRCEWRRMNARLCRASYGNGNGWMGVVVCGRVEKEIASSMVRARGRAERARSKCFASLIRSVCFF